MPLGDVVQRDGREEQKIAVHLSPAAPPHELVEQEERQRAEHNARRGGAETAAGGPPSPSVRWQDEAPHARRHHHARGKAQQRALRALAHLAGKKNTVAAPSAVIRNVKDVPSRASISG